MQFGKNSANTPHYVILETTVSLPTSPAQDWTAQLNVGEWWWWSARPNVFLTVWFLWALLDSPKLQHVSPDSQWRLLPWGRAPCWSLWPAETWGESRWISSRQRTARRPAAHPASGGWRTAWAAPSRPAVRWAEVRSCCPQVRLHLTAGGSLQPKTGGGDSCDEQLDFECLLIAILMLVSIPTQDLQEQWPVLPTPQ